MAKKPFTNAELINYAIGGTVSWENIPPETRALYEQRKNALDASTTAGKRLINDTFMDLINRVGDVRLHRAIMTNPLAFFRQGEMKHGDWAQDVIIKPAKAQLYRDEKEEKNPFNAEKAVVLSAYTQTNRQQKYSVGWRNVDIYKAFSAAEQFAIDGALNQFVQTVQAGSTRDEYLFSKELIKASLTGGEGGAFPLRQAQTCLIPDIRDPYMNIEMVATAIAIMEQRLSDMFYNSSEFNAGGVERALPQSDVVWLMHKDAAVVKGVKSLAYAYNPRYQEDGKKIYQVESFGEGNDDIIAIACEPNTYRVLQQERETAPEPNPATGYLSIWHRVIESYVWNPYGCMRVFRATAKSQARAAGCDFSKGADAASEGEGDTKKEGE